MPKPQGMHPSTYISKLRDEFWNYFHQSPSRPANLDWPSKGGSVAVWEDLRDRMKSHVEKIQQRQERKIKQKQTKINKIQNIKKRIAARKAGEVAAEKRRKEKKQAREEKEVKVKMELHGGFSDIGVDYRITPESAGAKVSLFNFTEAAINNMRQALLTALQKHNGIKVQLAIVVEMRKPGLEESMDFAGWSNRKSAPPVIMNEGQIDAAINEIINNAIEEIDSMTHMGSGWFIQSIEHMDLSIFAYKPFAAGEYIPLPKKLANRKACINMKNMDNKCFMWCVLRALHPRTKDAEHINSLKEYENELDFTGIKFPVKVTDIEKFQKLNNIGINLFGYSDRVYPMQLCRGEFKKVVNLLLIGDVEKDTTHYVLIKNFSRILGKVDKGHHKKFICMNCMQMFGRQDLLDKHQTFGCLKHTESVAVLPKKKKAFVEFNNHKNQLKSPVVIYADFEAFTKCCNQQNGKKTEAYQTHECAGYGYVAVSEYKELRRDYKEYLAQYDGDNVIEKFLKSINEDVIEMKKVLSEVKQMKLTQDDWKMYNNATTCHICDKPFEKLNKKKSNKGKIKVRDHDHINGNFRGAAHAGCNLNFKYGKIPVFFHNLRGYDSHFIMQEIHKISENVTCIPNTMDKYISFSTEHIVFKDSVQFLLSSLESLVGNLPKQEFKCLREQFNNDEYLVDLLTRKGDFPYDYMNSVDKFKDTKIPELQDWYSKLDDKKGEFVQLLRAQHAWIKLRMKNMGDYTALYMKTDVCLLADVFENFRNVCMKTYGLDPAHYFTSPGLSWDAMLKHTKVRIETFNDKQYNMQLQIEKGMRGGISTITHRYARANNKYMKNYNPEEKSSYIMYYDKNNLYGWAMSQSLPIGEYAWNEEKWDIEKIMKLDNEGETGYIFEVDLEYPKELHDLHNDYPLAPESRLGELSPLMSQIKNEMNIGEATVEKLIPTLYDKKNYVLHYHNLKLYLSLGLKLKKVHNVLQFKQSKWLAPYIMKNTIERTKAKSDFEKDFYKLMNNSVFGKTMENVRRRIKVDLVTTKEKAEKLMKQCNVQRWKNFNNWNLVAIQRKTDTVKFNKPTIVGMCILDISKTLMYDYHYNTVKAKYGNRATLCFTDTDSLTYHIETEDVYKDMYAEKEEYDFSEYDENSPFYDKSNKKVIGKMKDEMNGVPIVEFVGLRAKMYSNLIDNGDVKKTAKGIKKAYMKNNIKHENYKAAIFDKSQMRQTAKFNLIRSRKHIVQSITVEKVGLCCFDDKRYILEDNIHTYAHGHYKIRA